MNFNSVGKLETQSDDVDAQSFDYYPNENVDSLFFFENIN